MQTELGMKIGKAQKKTAVICCGFMIQEIIISYRKRSEKSTFSYPYSLVSIMISFLILVSFV